MDSSTRAALIAKYKEGIQVVADALAGSSETDLDARPAPGKWSAREIVHHLADSEMIAAIRLRLLLAEDQARLTAFDQKLYAGRLFYDRPIQASLEAFRAARQSTAEILDRMTEAQWHREGTHSETGRYTPEKWLEIYARHAHTHAAQIRKARSAARAA
ncbi:MAG TPA: DinB family protein [Candidatus Baltobacteraceae bacterium]|nr:DinB family protein [Candidatus Baltobacteraceae bacterium]